MLDKLAENHDLWVNMVTGMGCKRDVAQDIVQEMYIRMHRLIKDEQKIMYNDEEVNKFFVYITLKNMFNTYMRVKNKQTFFEYQETDDFEIEYDLQAEELEIEFEEGYHYLTSSILNEISSWHPYDAKLASIYFKTNLSLRDISGGTGISLTSIFNSVKNYRKILKDMFIEDYEDYLNYDYNQLKEKQ